MRRIIFFTLSICLSLPLLSQTKGNVSVCIRDSVNKALPDVGAMFFQSDSLVAGITTGKDGCFSLSLDTGNYTVHVTHLGYEEYTGEIHLTPAGVRLPTIVLKEAVVELDAVTISNRTFSAESNRSLFKIPANVKSSSTDIYQVLSTVPALIVNPVEKTAALAGSENSIIMVNNIRRDRAYLSIIDIKDIDRVEIIRSPGSRYKNVDGIINIVAKAPAAGQSLYLSGRLEPTLEQGYFDGGYVYTGEKVSASLMLQNFFFDDANGKESIIRDVSVGNDVTHTEKNSTATSSSFMNSYIGANIDYLASPKTFTSLNLSYAAGPAENESPYAGSVSSGSQDYKFDALSKSKSDFNKYQLKFYLQTDFNKKNSMNIDARYDMTSTESNSLYNESNNSGHFYENRQINNTDAQGFEAQVNFQHQLSKVRFEEGYRIYLDDNVIDNETNGVFNKTDHNEWRHYLYANLLGNISEKLVYQAGAGFDMSRVTLNNALSTHNELTPNAMLRYIMKGGQNISLNYSLTRKSPPSSALNPIPSYVDSSRIVTGNPDLKPYYLNTLGLSYELYKNKIYIQSSLWYSLANNYITRQDNLDENGVYHITYVNASRYSSATASLNASYSIFNWWQIMMNGSMRYNMYEDDNIPRLNKNFWTYSAWLSSSVNYKRLSLMFNAPVSFRNASLTGYALYTTESSINASYRLNNSWSVTGMFRYLTPTRYKTETFGDGFTEIYDSKTSDRYLRFILGIRYSFQKGKQQQYRQRNVKNYDDEASVGVRSY
ncbi:MAG: TonB-dependent receptor [Prevotellaceae bacterium]|jgi:outer membrane receptor protein involved in Fe transport|nr:TonB-dependent receptor [Prevotellaceae bacterium]